MSDSLQEFLKIRAKSRRLTDGRDYLLVSNGAIEEASVRCGLSVRQVQLDALEHGLVPARYAQNMPDYGFEGQQKIIRSSIAVVGAGGIGGHVCELLARSGVGRLIIIDGDSFDETNLNRQILCTEPDVGKPKAEVALRRVSQINSSVQVEAVVAFADERNLPAMISGADVLIDCVDTARTRFVLQKVCADLSIPMIHGTLGGFIGRVLTVFPGDKGMDVLYDRKEIGPIATEAREHGEPPVYTGPPSGSPAVSPAAIAPWQVSEALKIVTGQGSVLRNQVLVVDLLNNRAAVFPMSAMRLARLANRFQGRVSRPQ